MNLAGITNNRSILEKADLALANLISDGGYLQPEQAAKFMRILIKQSKLMGMSTVVPMKSPKHLIEKIKFTGRVLRAGNEGQALAEDDRVKPDTSKIELDAELFKAECRLTNETLEDSIERGELRQTIMQLLGDAIARDMEEVMLQGDTSSSDLFLAQFDGLLKQAVSNVVDAGDVKLNKTLFRDNLRALPSEFLRNKGDMRFLTSVDAEIDYRDTLADRVGALGDKFLEQEAAVSYSGVPVIDLQLMPENIGTGSHCTDILFLDPKNINVGVWRNIRIETDKLVREGVLIIVATLRFDVKYAHEPAVVKTTNVNVA
jgi:hypothetical protein